VLNIGKEKLETNEYLRTGMPSINNKLVKVNFSCALSRDHGMKAYWWSGDIAPLILDLGTRWR
jgi:hypothetical protein